MAIPICTPKYRSKILTVAVQHLIFFYFHWSGDYISSKIEILTKRMGGEGERETTTIWRTRTCRRYVNKCRDENTAEAAAVVAHHFNHLIDSRQLFWIDGLSWMRSVLSLIHFSFRRSFSFICSHQCAPKTRQKIHLAAQREKEKCIKRVHVSKTFNAIFHTDCKRLFGLVVCLEHSGLLNSGTRPSENWAKKKNWKKKTEIIVYSMSTR